MSTFELFSGTNSHLIEVELSEEVLGFAFSDALVTLESLRDSEGADLPGLGTPLVIPPVTGGAGSYRVTLDRSLDILPGQPYTYVIRALFGGDIGGEWTCTTTAGPRSGC